MPANETARYGQHLSRRLQAMTRQALTTYDYTSMGFYTFDCLGWPFTHLLLFDEPLSNLDAKLRAHVRGELRPESRRAIAWTWSSWRTRCICFPRKRHMSQSRVMFRQPKPDRH